MFAPVFTAPSRFLALVGSRLAGLVPTPFLRSGAQRTVRLWRTRLLAVVFLVLSAVPAAAQVTGGIIQGIISDPQGAAIASVEVTATNSTTSVGVTTRTNTAGFYEFPSLNPGIYNLAARVAGFAPYIRSSIELTMQQRLRVDMAMQLAGMQQAVEVTGTPTVVETESAGASHLIQSDAIANLPAFGRNVLTLAQLVAGANPINPDGYTSTASTFTPSSFSFNGSPAQGNSILVNGVVNQYGNGAMGLTPSTYSVQEVRVQSFALSAEYGQTSGSVISFETKSGTNKPHGALWYFHNEPTLNANDFFSDRAGQPKPKTPKTQLGGNFGGPLWIPRVYDGRSRTFFFFDYEGIRDRNAAASSISTVPTAQERRGDFSATRALDGRAIQIFNPFTGRTVGSTFTRDPFPGNVVPSNLINQTAVNILKWVPLPNLPGSTQNFIYNASYPNQVDQWQLRIDHHVGDRDLFFASFGQAKLGSRYPGTLQTGVNGYWNDSVSRLLTLGHTHIFSPSVLLSLRAGVQQYAQDVTPLTTPEDRDALGLPKSFTSMLTSTRFPRIACSDMSVLSTIFRAISYYTPNVRVSLTQVVGRQSLTYGYEFRSLRDFSADYADEGGMFNFTRSWTQGPAASAASATTGHGIATMLLGTVTAGSVTMNSSSASQSVYHAAYLQDNWRLTRRLTLNMGLRYDYQTPITERFNRMNRGFDETTPSPVATQAEANYSKNPLPEFPNFKVRGGITFAGGKGIERYNFEPDRSNVMPRVGATYAVTPKTVVRGGYGIFYLPLVEARNQNISSTTLPMSQLGFSSTTTMQTTLGGLPLNTLANPYPQGLVQPTGSTLGMATSLGQSITVYDGRGERALSHQFQANVQRELPSRILLDLAYVGSRVSKLPVSEQVNEVPAEYLNLRDTLIGTVANPFYGLITVGTLSTATVSKSQLLLKYPQFTGVTVDFRPIGSSWYNSLQISASKRFSKTVTFRAAYTMSKLMDRRRFQYLYYPLEQDISQIDRPHRLVVSGLWDLPVGPLQKFGRRLPALLLHVIGDWRLSWVTVFQNGMPTGAWSNAVVTGTPRRVERTVDQWFDTSVFAPKPTYATPSISTYISQIRADGRKNLDLTIAKDFPVREALRFRLQVQMFNAFNTPQFAQPNVVVTNLAFGSVSDQ